MKVYVIRHGEGTHNVSNDVSIFDPSLTSKGVNQCENVRKNFPDVDMVICSTATRAIQTAKNIFPGKRIHATDLLLEYNTGVPCNSRLNLKFQRNRFPDVDFDTYFSAPLPCEHTWDQCQDRAKKVLKVLHGLESEIKTVALVSHQNFGQNLASVMGLQPLYLSNCDHYTIPHLPDLPSH